MVYLVGDQDIFSVKHNNAWTNMSVNTECFKHSEKLKGLRVAHRDLDHLIVQLSVDPYVDQVHLRRLKKRKLSLKDNITRLESQLIPDLNA